ncbi:MAG: putative N-acetylmuramoyl-L-alanine amidase amiC [Rhodospirillales bacterium]|nr:putative N-acetylmuramoyl-L-alanine amidase amiC [Rhodospirillales bacterium]
MAWRFIYAIILTWGLAAASAAEAATATDLRVGVNGERTRLVIDLSSKVDFNVFTLSDPYRLVIDSSEIDWRLSSEAGQRGGLIEAVRYGQLQPGVSRLVVDLKQPAKVGNSFVMPPSEGQAYRLVFDLVPVDHASFMAAARTGEAPAAATASRAEPRTEPKAVPSQPGLQATPQPKAAATGTKTAAISPPGTPGRKPERFKRKVIVIDPGHGGVDPGALAPSGAYEKDITLAAAKDFKRRLDATRRYDVHLTRDNDTFIRLRDRIGIARAKGADLFISLHADSLASKGVRGMSVYTLSEKASDKEAAELADKENKADLIAGIDLTSENANVTNILIDLAQRETMNESARFAGNLVGELRTVSKVLPQAHRFAGFAVLKAPDVPSVLLEMGFLSNPQDEKALTDPVYRARMADSLLQAVNRFFRQVEKAERN